ncbi:MAG: IcmO, partial [uncultured bacterium]
SQDEGEEIQIISDSITAQEGANSIERALGALLAFHNRHVATTESVAEVEEEVSDGRLNIFSKVHLNDFVKTLIGSTQFDQFSQPLLNKRIEKDKVELLERLMGRSAAQANPMTNEILKDMANATDYPPQYESVLLPSEEVVALANELCDYVISLKKPKEEGF